ncbi:DUF3616 domain-containing protein [Stigmatella aurantiaca]|uniref:DUF3616 domain-containing protein n=1 Tax=Stigmatella aurantiaca (strain DW4/3-1) TaxID=378806 RepID=Q08QX7_STIAD|nr:DUF3616 domain-containing protein [Stigmatella aurantiaca]ADO72755.1 uncharacterized protein STAUR_4977 [Stigmatella aurantiaca DW4/3-1]EAU62887.1 hypothetical protein STIAU_1139 [Stigmatella aurantiaca DW4/3-1]
MRGWKVPVIGALTACALLAGGCGTEAPVAGDERRELGLDTQGLAGTQSAVFQDGVSPSSSYAGTRDAMIEEEHPSANHGRDTSLSASGDTPSGSGNENYILLRWDVSSIPTHALVRSASISVTVSDKADQSYGIYELTRAWDEGQVTWEKADSGHSWASKGADGSGDRDTRLLGALKASSTGTYTVALNAAGLEVVKRWVAAPSLNQGLIVANKDNDNRLEIRSREFSDKSSRPKLTVVWELPSGEEPGGGEPQAGTYSGTCDGSGGVWIDSGHFLNFNDESQTARIFGQGLSSPAVQSKELSSALGLSASEEADLEDAARVGNRIYVTSSHARDKNGKLEASRYKFFAMDVSGTVPSASLQVVGVSSNLLRDMLDASNWTQANASVISLLEERSQLSKATVARLAPKEEGVNLEGLAAMPSGALLVGFRNPRSGSNAIAVSLTNRDAVISGAKARFGQAFLLNLGGHGIRGMAWSETHQAVLILSGPHDESNGPFALWKWGGDASSVPQKVAVLTAPSDSAPEAIIPLPGTDAVRILFDMGSHLIDGEVCKDVPSSSQSFSDVVVTVSR